jgi:hypothetical protein
VTGPFSQAELDVMFFEFNSGLTPLGAARPMFPWELRAGTDFAGIDRDVSAAQGKTQLSLDQVRDVIAREMVTVLGEASTPAEAARLLADFAATQPPAVREAIAAATATISEVLAELYNTGAAAVLLEGAAQGAVAVAEPELAEAAELAAHARVGPAWLWSKLTQVAMETGGSRIADVTAVRESLLGASIRAAYDLARQATNVTYAQGRLSGIKAMPEPVAVYASELLDGNTCTPCADIDGVQFASLADALLAYPDGGLYGRCDGGDRCRGTLVVIFSSEENPRSD